MNATEFRRVHDQLVKDLVDGGKLIEAGFVGLRRDVIAPDAPTVQVEEMRMAFMAGAQHLWASINAVLDPGDEPSMADMRRMAAIADELDAYAKTLAMRVIPTAGRKQ